LENVSYIDCVFAVRNWSEIVFTLILRTTYYVRIH